jgi:hypothetical protein
MVGYAFVRVHGCDVLYDTWDGGQEVAMVTRHT